MTRFSRWFVVLAFILVPASVSSLGLGDIELNSYLNERLDAQISITVAGPEELESLQVNVASREVFERFGVERVDFLNDLSFTVDRLADGRAVVRVRSSEAIVEPFVTFLIEARSSGGRLLREYTVLLDPPLYLPEPEPAAEAPAAPVQPAPSSGPIAQPREPVRTTDSRPRVAAPTTYGPVRRNQTLWGIAESVRPDGSVSINQAMISLYQANPDAFDGNINRLRAGATLRVPDYAEMTRLSAGQALAEVRRHNREWSQARAAPSQADTRPTPVAAAPEPEESRLVLVPPAGEGATRAPSGASTTAAPDAGYVREQEALNEEMLAAVESMQSRLDDALSAIAVRDAEIAALEARLAAIEAGRPSAPGDSQQETAGPDVGEAPSREGAAPAVEQPVAAEPEPTSAGQPAPTPPPAQLGAPADEGGLFSSLWTWIIIVAVALLGAAVFWRRRQEGADEAYESWASVDDDGRPMVPATATATAAAGGAVAEDIVVEEPHLAEATDDVAEEADERGTREETVEAAPPTEPRAEQDAPEGTGEYAYPFEDTIAGATGINLEQSDPLAEADFHMAYGLYDQAADLIKKAIERDPDRIDLRMKLLDILFVWGKQDEFLEEAKALQVKLGDAGSSDWERIAIMGRQICPDEQLFGQEGEGDMSAAAGSDIDFPVGGDKAEPAESDGLDFDLSPTGEMPGIDIDITQETIAPESTAEVEIEDLGLDIDIESLGEDVEQTAATDADEAEEAIEEPAEEEPAEETGVTEVLERGDTAAEVEETGLTEVFERVEEATEDETGVVRAEDLDIADLDTEGETKELPALDLDTAGPDDETTEVEALKEGEDLSLEELTAELDVDLDKTVEIPIAGAQPDGETLIDEVFGDEGPEGVLEEAADAESTQEMPAVKPSDVTLSEVGTKLDLARAYIDMGDPDGARTILEEVVDEGDDSQKGEARQLLEGLG